MPIFEDCVCIAQARVIAGHKREPHICTIAYQPSTSQFLRICIPFVLNRSPLIKRWSRFSFDGTKEGLGNDTRHESWNLRELQRLPGKPLTQKQKNSIHQSVLAEYKYESELNEAKGSIGLLIPIPETLRLYTEHLSPRHEEDCREIERVKLLESKGIWYPAFRIKIEGYYMKNGKRAKFDKQLLAWDFYEALRQGDGRNPYAAAYSYRHPYLIIGNLATQRRGWVVVGVLSAPDGAIENCAIHQQLELSA
jgi:hypothetical protein